MNKSLLNRLVVIIPAYNPDQKLLQVLINLQNKGFSNIILVDDGSKAETQDILDKASELLKESGGVLLRHHVNLGQGRAYKTAFNYYLGNYPDSIGVIQCDADGQHHIEDICKCAELLLQYPTDFVLGARNFNEKGIPFRSRFGNKCTNFIFHFFCGIKIKDTQTGLKGIPRELIKYLIETPGERFEYATSVLLEVKKRSYYIRQFDIQTIYINENESSHFNPVLDSIRIYSLLLKYTFSSLSAFIVDIFLFALFINLFSGVLPKLYIIVSNYCAKLFSCTYSFFINKKFVFEKKGNFAGTVTKFIFLCIIQSSISSILINGLHDLLQWNSTLLKIIVDTLLFFVSFQVQQKWIFKQEIEKNVD